MFHDGFGIGLPFAQKIIAAHGGKIDVESDLSRGSLFRVILPIHATSDDDSTQEFRDSEASV